GIYSLSMKVDGLEHYSHVMDELDFDNFRQVNCHKDYDLFHLNRWRYHKCFPSENNTLEIYDLLVDGGKIHLRPGDSFDVEFIVKDIDGNESQIAFELNCGEPLKTSAPIRDGVLMDASTDNIFTVDGLAVRIPHGRIYDDFYLRPSRKARPNGPSDLFYLNDRDIPLDDEIVISLQSRMPRSEWKYSILEHTDYRGRVNYIKGTMRDGWYEVRSKYLGAYRLVEDRVSPQISIEYSSKSRKLNLHLSDDISGVDTMSVEVNGNWLRMAHNASMSRAWGDLNEIELPSGRTDIRVYARDLAGNEVIEMRKVHLLK
ncbi:MAG: hypothetical protein HKO93_07660, partial [Flavobacteriales bacterium]|nr:hypothetical protein [Flavobacteriales bacterium]